MTNQILPRFGLAKMKRHLPNHSMEWYRKAISSLQNLCKMKKAKREITQVFIGEMMDVKAGLATAKFLIKSTKVDHVYMYPKVEDVQCISFSQIL
jgi:hypothetical protein